MTTNFAYAWKYDKIMFKTSVECACVGFEAVGISCIMIYWNLYLKQLNYIYIQIWYFTSHQMLITIYTLN